LEGGGNITGICILKDHSAILSQKILSTQSLVLKLVSAIPFKILATRAHQWKDMSASERYLIISRT